MASTEVQQPVPSGQDQNAQSGGDAATQQRHDEERQRQLDQKMEEMRRKNEALRKRHEEIEADKRNANMNSRIANSRDEEDSGSESDEESSDDEDTQFPRGPSKEKITRQLDESTSPKSPNQDTPRPSKGRGRASPNAAAVPYQQPGHPCRHSGDGGSHHVPPPDPKYNFLDDPVRRDGRDGRGGGGRGGDGGSGGGGGGGEFRRGGRTSFEGNRGHFDSGYGQGQGRSSGPAAAGVSRGRGRRSAEASEQASAPEVSAMDYNRWKEERARIDAERLARQQTSSGQWKREWDVDKSFQRQEDSRYGDRNQRSQGGGGGGWHDNDRQSYQRGPPRGGRQQEYRNGGGNRQVYSAGRGFKVEVQQERDERGGGSGGGGFQYIGRGRGRLQNNDGFGGREGGGFGGRDGGGGFGGRDGGGGGFGGRDGGGGFGRDSGDGRDSGRAGAGPGPGQDHEKSFGALNRTPRGRGGPPSSRGRPSPINPRESDSAQEQKRKPATETRQLQQGASLDTPSSEYASPEPQMPPKEEARGGKTEAREEEDQWEDVEDDGGTAEAFYFDDPHYGDVTPAGVDHHNVSDEMSPEDESALAAKLNEIEKQVRENSAQPDLEATVASGQDVVVGGQDVLTGASGQGFLTTAGPNEAKDVQEKKPLADLGTVLTVVEKETGAIRRRQTTDGVVEGPELTGEEGHEDAGQVERARHESMDQIERDMIATMNENIQAVEAALGRSEDDLDFLLSTPGAMTSAHAMEGAEEEELLREDDISHDHVTLRDSASASSQQGSDNTKKVAEKPKTVEISLEDEVD